MALSYINNKEIKFGSSKPLNGVYTPGSPTREYEPLDSLGIYLNSGIPLSYGVENNRYMSMSDKFAATSQGNSYSFNQLFAAQMMLGFKLHDRFIACDTEHKIIGTEPLLHKAYLAEITEKTLDYFKIKIYEEKTRTFCIRMSSSEAPTSYVDLTNSFDENGLNLTQTDRQSFLSYYRFYPLTARDPSSRAEETLGVDYYLLPSVEGLKELSGDILSKFNAFISSDGTLTNLGNTAFAYAGDINYVPNYRGETSEAAVSAAKKAEVILGRVEEMHAGINQILPEMEENLELTKQYRDEAMSTEIGTVRGDLNQLKGDLANFSESVINEESFSKTSNTSGYTYGRLYSGETQKFFAYSDEIKNLNSVVYFDSTKYAIGIYYYDRGNNERSWYEASPVVLSEIGVDKPTFRVQVRKVGYTDVDLNDVCNDVKVKSYISNNIVYKNTLSDLFKVRCGINRFNPNDTECFRTDGTDGYYLGSNGVVIPQLGETWSVSGFIPVDAGHKVYLRFSINKVNIINITPITWIFLDAEKNVLSSVGQVSECIVPANAKWMRICINDSFFGEINGMVSQDSPMHMYEPYEEKLIAKNEVFDEDKWDIVLPQNMRVLVGNESSICPQNIARYFEPKEMSLVDVTGFTSKFNRFVLTPVNTTEFESYVMVYRGNTKNPVKSEHVNIIPTASNSGDGVSKNILIIGDSMTEAGVYTQELVDLFSSDGMHINLIGTKGNGTNRHEGRGGWSSETYVHTDEARVPQNPFLKDGVFDFSNYMSVNEFGSVDYVLINLGTNDVAQDLSDDRIYENYMTMINSIKSYNPNVIIGLWLAPTRGISGANTSRLAIDQCLRSNRLLIDKFDGKEASDNIYLIPIVGLDNDFDYVYVENKRKFEIENEDYTRTILQESQYFCSETVHPSTLGYKNIAKAIYPYIKYWGGLIN